MSRTARNPTPQDAQAMKAIQRILASQIALMAASPAAEQLSLFEPISQKQETFPATATPSDEVRGEVRRVEIPDFLKVRYRR